MKKMLVLLSLLVVALFVVSCAPKEGEEGAIAGQAVGSGKSVILQNCADSDNGLKYEVKGYVSGYKFNAKTKKYDIYYQEDDACVGEDLTTNLPSSNHVREMTCLTSKKTKSQVQNCLDLAPKGTKTCVNGVCVSAGVCGNKVLEVNEICDDGNQMAGDGCSADCKSVEAGWICKDNITCSKTCIPGPTGNWDCINPAGAGTNYYYYTQEMQDYYCTKSYSKNYPNYTWCGYGVNSCKDDVGCCKDELVSPLYCDGNFLVNKTKNPCTGEMKETKFECIAGTTCQNGVCQKKTCVSEPTGNWDCINESGTYYYAQEIYKSDCSKSYSTSWGTGKLYCGNKPESCMEDKGCCNEQLLPSICDGNILINNTKNSCTEKVIGLNTICSNITGGIAKKLQVCGTKINSGKTSVGCYEPCTPGEEVTACYSYGSPTYVCNDDGLDYKWKNYSNSGCPAGTTCQNNVCK